MPNFGTGPISGQIFTKGGPAPNGQSQVIILNQGAPGKDCESPRDPAIQFIKVTGQPVNQVINLTPAAKYITVINLGLGPFDSAAWISWIPLNVSAKDIDTVESFFQPGLFMGTGPEYTFAGVAPFVPSGANGNIKYRAPYVKLCSPTEKFFFTGWLEDNTTGVTVIADGNWLIIASSDIEDLWTTNIGGF